MPGQTRLGSPVALHHAIVRGDRKAAGVASLFYKTPKGALVGDMFMSLIQTCDMARQNAFDYLVALQKNALALAANPEKWLPWNFRQAIPATNQ